MLFRCRDESTQPCARRRTRDQPLQQFGINALPKRDPTMPKYCLDGERIVSCIVRHIGVTLRKQRRLDQLIPAKNRNLEPPLLPDSELSDSHRSEMMHREIRR